MATRLAKARRSYYRDLLEEAKRSNYLLSSSTSKDSVIDKEGKVIHWKNMNNNIIAEFKYIKSKEVSGRTVFTESYFDQQGNLYYSAQAWFETDKTVFADTTWVERERYEYNGSNTTKVVKEFFISGGHIVQRFINDQNAAIIPGKPYTYWHLPHKKIAAYEFWD